MKMVFNVLDAGWIPVTCNDGSLKMLGIREVLRDAHHLKCITAETPVEEYCLYRFLGLFLMDAIRPEKLSAIRRILKAERFDMEIIESYISLCEAEGVSFDAFDEKKPFMQSAYAAEWDKEPKPVAALDIFCATGNNHAHFDHNRPEDVTVTVDKAVRLLLAMQQFCTVMGQGYPSGVNGAPPYFSIVHGKNLFETLVYTLQPVNTIGIPFDEPPVIWRAKAPVEPKRVVTQTSWLRGLFFPARRILLIPPEDGMHVKQVYLAQGENYTNFEAWHDPYVTYRTVQAGTAPYRPNHEKPAWRSLYELIDIPGKHASQILEQYLNLTDSAIAEITLYGVETANGNYMDLMREELRFPTAITEDPLSVELIKMCTQSAEQLARALKRNIAVVNALSQPAASKAVDDYYRKCEKEFWTLCTAIGNGLAGTYFESWCEKIGTFATTAFDETVKLYYLRAKDLGRVEEHRRYLLNEVKKVKKVKEALVND